MVVGWTIDPFEKKNVVNKNMGSFFLQVFRVNNIHKRSLKRVVEGAPHVPSFGSSSFPGSRKLEMYSQGNQNERSRKSKTWKKTHN